VALATGPNAEEEDKQCVVDTTFGQKVCL